MFAELVRPPAEIIASRVKQLCNLDSASFGVPRQGGMIFFGDPFCHQLRRRAVLSVSPIALPAGRILAGTHLRHKTLRSDHPPIVSPDRDQALHDSCNRIAVTRNR